MQKGFAAPLVILGFVVLIVIAAGAFYVGKFTQQRFSQQSSIVDVNSKAPASTQAPEPESKPDYLDKYFTYELEDGWIKGDSNKTEYVSFVSRDIKEDVRPSLLSGAEIRVSRFKEFYGSPEPQTIEELKEDIIKNTTEAIREKYRNIKIIQINNQNSLNQYSCWEGCVDAYYLLHNGYVWLITFQMAPIWASREEMDKSQYGKGRDLFLKTFRLVD